MTRSVLLLALAACRPAPGGSDPRDATPGESDPPESDVRETDAPDEPGETDTPDDCAPPRADAFDAAAVAYGVPVDLLRAVALAETGMRMVAGHQEHPGRPAAHGVMGLRDDVLPLAARLADVPPEAARRHLASNVRATAALLSAWADEAGLDRGDLGAWAPVVARYGGAVAPEATARYVHDDVYGPLRHGAVVHGRHLLPRPVMPAWPPPLARIAADHAGAVWRPSPNFNSRGGRDVELVVIHTCEGAYSGCWGWLVNADSGVSAHYVVKEDGSEVSQLVEEDDRAWHIAATYDCDNNHGQRCDLDGLSSNTLAVGVEHAGYASQASFQAGMIQRSAELVCDVTRRHGVPRDAYHIVAHGQLQPWNRTDPGPNWPWTDYLRRIREACGDEVPSEAPTLVIGADDTSDDPARYRFEASACWLAEAEGGFDGGYRVGPSDTSRSDPASFRFRVDDDTCYAVDAWWVAAPDHAARTAFLAVDPSGRTLATWYADQTTSGGRWNELGAARFPAGWNRVDVSRWVAAGRVAVADAVRLRPSTACP